MRRAGKEIWAGNRLLNVGLQDREHAKIKAKQKKKVTIRMMRSYSRVWLWTVSSYERWIRIVSSFPLIFVVCCSLLYFVFDHLVCGRWSSGWVLMLHAHYDIYRAVPSCHLVASLLLWRRMKRMRSTWIALHGWLNYSLSRCKINCNRKSASTRHLMVMVFYFILLCVMQISIEATSTTSSQPVTVVAVVANCRTWPTAMPFGPTEETSNCLMHNLKYRRCEEFC